MRKRTLALLAALLSVALGLTACGSEETTTVTVTAASAETDEVGVVEPAEANTKEVGIDEGSEPTLDVDAGDEVTPRAIFRRREGDVVVVGTAEILSLNQTVGDPAWVPNAQNRVQNGIWAFYKDGRAYFDTVDVRDDLYPLSGGYRVSGNQVSFDVGGTVQEGYSSFATSEMIGTIDISTGPATMRFTWASESGSAAVVAGQPVSGGSSSAYEVEISLR